MSKLNKEQKIDWFIRNCFSEFGLLNFSLEHPETEKEKLTVSQMSSLAESKIDKLKIRFDELFNQN